MHHKGIEEMIYPKISDISPLFFMAASLKREYFHRLQCIYICIECYIIMNT